MGERTYTKRRDGLYKRPDSPYWWITYKDPSGRRKQVSTGTESRTLAKQIRIERIREAQRQIEGIKTYSDIPIDVFCGMFLDYVKARRAYNTVRSYKTTVGAFLKYLQDIGIERLSEVDRRHVEDYLTFLIDRLKLKKKTCNNRLVTIKAMFSWAVSCNYRKMNPATGIKKLRETDSKAPKALDDGEYKRFMLLCKEMCPHYYPIFYTFVHTGLRFGELINLEWDDLDFESRRIWIKKSKGSDVPEPVYIHDSLKEVLLSLPRKGRGKKVFLDELGRPFGHRSKKISRRLKMIAQRANIPDLTRLHELRHTFCSQLIDKGVDPFHVRDLMRHKDISTTQGYVRLFGYTMQDKAKVLEILDSF